MKYTTIEIIAKKLEGRLRFNLESSTSPVNAIGSKVVDRQLVEEIIAPEVEEYVDMVIGQVYQLPLINEHFVIRDIATSLILDRITQIHFQGQPGQEAVDISLFAANNKNHALSLLQAITAGHNIYFGNTPPSQTIPGAITPQPIVLVGEKARTTGLPDTITRNQTVIGGRKLTPATLGIDWGGKPTAHDGYTIDTTERKAF
jgi:hypothetical protein